MSSGGMNARRWAGTSSAAWPVYRGQTIKRKCVRTVGLEPTSTNTLQLECNPLDRSGKCASGALFPNCFLFIEQMVE